MVNTLPSAAPAALLLGLAAALVEPARDGAYERARVLLLAVVLTMATTSLWWPAHWGLNAHTGLLGTVLGLALGAALTAVVVLSSKAARGSDRWFSARRAQFAGLAWLIATTCLAMLTMSSAGRGQEWLFLSALAGGVLVGALVLSCWPWAPGRRGTRLRTAAAIGASSVPALAVHPVAATPWADPGLWMIGALTLLGGLLHLLLQRLPGPAQRRRRLNRTSGSRIMTPAPAC